MKNLKRNFLGVYEKALPPLEWEEKFRVASENGFDFIEMSIDESDVRLERLEWTDKEIDHIKLLEKKYDIFIRSICFSGQRRFPLGSHDVKVQQKSLELLDKCILLAFKLGVRIIQLAGYDVFYEEKDLETRETFFKNLNKGLQTANRYGVNLSIEIMDDPFINSITKYLYVKDHCPSPWLSVYPDLGNLSAWNGENTIDELEIGFGEINALHIKDTLAVTTETPGKFKNVDFGTGCVKFVDIFKYLEAKEYSGSFVIEAWFEDFDEPEKRLKNAKSWVLDQFRRAGYSLC